MSRLIISSSLLFLCSLVLGCSKSKKAQEIVATVHVYDSETGEPIQASVTLCWDPSTVGGWTSHEEPKSTSTDSQGYANITYKIPKGDKYSKGNYIIRIKRPGFIALEGYINDSKMGVMRSVSRDSENNIEVALDPFYAIKVTAVNVSCTSPTDSVWIDVAGLSDLYTGPNYARQAYGCADTLLPGTFPYGEMKDWILCNVDHLDFQITTKKSGAINSYVESFNLINGSVTPIAIEY